MNIRIGQGVAKVVPSAEKISFEKKIKQALRQIHNRFLQKPYLRKIRNAYADCELIIPLGVLAIILAAILGIIIGAIRR